VKKDKNMYLPSCHGTEGSRTCWPTCH